MSHTTPQTPESKNESTSEKIPAENSRRFEELYAGNERIIYQFVCARLRNSDRKDVFQTAIHTGIKRIHTLTSPNVFLSWMYQIVKTTVADYWRDKADKNEYQPGQEEEVWQRSTATMRDNPEKTVLAQEQSHLVDAVLSRLDQNSHLVVTLKFYEKKSFPEIAKIMGLTVDQVKYHWKKAKPILRSELKDYFLSCLPIAFNQEQILQWSRQAYAQIMEQYPELTAFSSVTVGTTSATSSGSIASGTGFTWTGVLMQFTGSFLMGVSLILTGHFYGFEVVRHAPSLPARRWLVRYLLRCYGSALLLPMSILAACVLFTNGFGWNGSFYLFAGTVVFFLLGFVGHFLYGVLRYRNIYRKESTQASSASDPRFPSWPQLRRSVRRWFAGTSICLILFGVWFARQVLQPHYDYSVQTGHLPVAHFALATSIACCIGIALFHAGTYLLFRHYLGWTKDGSIVQPLQASRTDSPWQSKIACRICFWLATLPLLPPLVYHLWTQKHLGVAAIVFAAYVFSWYWVYDTNRRSTLWWGGFRILVVLVLQFAVLNILLQTIYE